MNWLVLVVDDIGHSMHTSVWYKGRPHICMGEQQQQQKKKIEIEKEEEEEEVTIRFLTY